ncbi:hypothetical protein NM688_g2233 [Phlebia brevispora]|uniref:Uncharacterized protein n=1 Tax=Phlebia brevispora TaxID=194682 RepID=A0ACC1T8Z0_9APHY|nr:hypothetical protein NM688_g2233 [Phlebia brevispora]
MDVSTLRSEIKNWEREFKGQYGHEPTVQDIKNTPGMPDKYKLYKRLSKQNTATFTASQPIPTDRPSTPPGSHSRHSRPSTSSTIPKPRAVKTERPVLTENPFSPVKSKDKQKALFPNSLPIASPSRANPFTTPRKAKQNPRVPRRDPSPDPFPLIQPVQTPSHKSSFALQHNPSTPGRHDESFLVRKDTAITRARKRLRGEPVSPSPVKEKRARVLSQTSLTFARHSTLVVHSEISDDEYADNAPEEGRGDAEEAVFFNSPVKRSADGKQFRSLFEEAPVTQQDVSARPHRPTFSRTRSTGAGPFASDPKKGKSGLRAISPEAADGADLDGPRGVGQKIKALDISLNGIRKPRKRQSFKNGPPRAVLPGKDDLWDETPGTRTVNAASNGTPPANYDNASQTRKRSLSKSSTDDDVPSQERGMSRPQLLPPSPPPADAKSSRYGGKGKGKGIPAGSRKKAKLIAGLASDGEDDEESSEDLNEQIKELPWSWNTHTTHTTRTDGNIPIDAIVTADSGPEFDPTSYRPAPVAAPPYLPASGEIEVRLPDDLKRVLALSPRSTKKQELEEEILARELLYGRREVHYDPNRGGEIWDVGELSDEVDDVRPKKTVSDEDEWEGEPVPWEVGEL